jgi:hypothetical protein
MNPLFEDYQLRGTTQGNPVVMDRQQLDLLRMIVQGYEGYGKQPEPGMMQHLLNYVTPRPKPQAPVNTYQQLGIRG